MSKFFVVFTTVIFSLNLASANVCICQYPNEKPKYGSSRKSEVSFYKVGCRVWFRGKKCRVKKVWDINRKLEKDIAGIKLKKNEILKVSFVGHWSNASETSRFVKNELSSILRERDISISYDNTACSPMDNPYTVKRAIDSLRYKHKQTLEVKGAQVTSIGIWDQLSFMHRKADLYAAVSSDRNGVIFPKCSEYLNKRCTKFQLKESGICLLNGQENRISCRKSSPNKAPRWNYH